jgi:hypothetical protein
LIQPITRIQFEPLANGRFRWRVWAGGKLVHDELSTPDSVDAIMLETKLLCTDVGPGESHAEEIEVTQAPEAHAPEDEAPEGQAEV